MFSAFTRATISTKRIVFSGQKLSVSHRFAPISALSGIRNYSTHNPDTYAKDDLISPSSDSRIFKVDPSSDNVQAWDIPVEAQWTKSYASTKEGANPHNSLSEGEATYGRGVYGGAAQNDQYTGVNRISELAEKES